MLSVMKHLCYAVSIALLMVMPIAVSQAGQSEETSMPSSNTGQPGTQQDEASIDNQLLVKFEDSLSEDQIATINARLGAQVVQRMQGGRLMLLEIPYPDTRPQIIDAYSKTEGVVYAEPNQAVSIPTPPADGAEGDDQPPDGSPTIGLPKVE
jgi:hypothetical protein